MTTINLIFSDNIKVSMLSTSFLFKYSDFFKSFDLSDLEEDIYIICPSNYVLDENNTCLFNEKEDLTFMFKLQCDAFINLCLFLDIISYDQPIDNNFSKQFIKYVMKNNITLQQTTCFMNKEIRSINNYKNNVDMDIQLRTCDINFYGLYLFKTKKGKKKIKKGLIIKHNRIDIYDKYYKHIPDLFFIYVYKYNTELSNIIKESSKYIQYIEYINNELFKCNNIYYIETLIDRGADLNIINSNGENILFHQNNLNIIKYLIEKRVPLIQNKNGYNLLHYLCKYCNNEYYNNIIKYILENTNIDINTQNNDGNTILHYLCNNYCKNIYNNNNEQNNIIKYILEYTKADINTQNNDGYTALHYVANNDNLELVKYLIEHGANVRLKTKKNKTAYSLGNIDIKQYIQSVDSYYKRYSKHNDDNYMDNI